MWQAPRRDDELRGDKLGTCRKGRRGQQDGAAESSPSVPKSMLEKAGIAPGVQKGNSDKLWEGTTLTPAMEDGYQETARDARRKPQE